MEHKEEGGEEETERERGRSGREKYQSNLTCGSVTPNKL